MVQHGHTAYFHFCGALSTKVQEKDYPLQTLASSTLQFNAGVYETEADLDFNDFRNEFPYLSIFFLDDLETEHFFFTLYTNLKLTSLRIYQNFLSTSTHDEVSTSE